MKFLKTLFFIVADLLIIACFAGACILQFFTKRKLGMLRWLNYNEAKALKAIPTDLLKYLVPVVVLILAILVARAYFAHVKSKTAFAGFLAVETLLIAAVYLVFTLTQSTETFRAYYFMLPCVGGAALIQLIKASVGIHISNK